MVGAKIMALDQFVSSRTYRADELVNLPVKTDKYIIKNLIYPGVNVLAGPPKAGKGIMSLQIALALCNNEPLFDRFQVDGGRVAYISYEDDEAEVKTRLNALCEKEVPNNFDIIFDFDRYSEGGSDILKNAMESQSHKVIIIDTLDKYKGGSGFNSYTKENEMVGELNAMARENNMAIVFLHHTTKNINKSNWLASIRGNQGLTGSATANLLIKRYAPKKKADLFITGRSGVSKRYVMSFDKITEGDDFCKWFFVGEYDENTLTGERLEILKILFEEKSLMKPKQLSEITGNSNKSASELLGKLKKAGYVVRYPGAKYELTENGENRVKQELNN